MRVAGRALAAASLAAASAAAFAQSADSHRTAKAPANAATAQQVPPRVRQAQRFLAERGIVPGRTRGLQLPTVRPRPQSAGTSVWRPIGPTAVTSQDYGLVTGRVSALALDPSDSTGNRLYVGATGGGVWFSQNAGSSASSGVVFVPLTDTAEENLSGVQQGSISIGALTVQPGATGVILAGTGDPNDALDSYYGAGILRSTNNGTSWNLIPEAVNSTGPNNQRFSFSGEGFAGFAWSTVNPEIVVAAVSQALEGTLVNAGFPQSSYEGLYYSTDSGATWSLATITDGSGEDIQGPNDPFVGPDGNAATSVVWNPVRRLFIAAVRFHGYYQSTNGETWTRMTAQPGSNLTTQLCPANAGGLVGSVDCPIFRGTLAVNPESGDTFAWTVDENNQDQGIWQDKCTIQSGVCSTQDVTFSEQWNTTALETDTLQGSVTIENGDYNLALAAVPSEQDTLLLAGANDLWKCSLAAGCTWRNTTNAFTCTSAEVGGYQHALAWNTANPLEIFVGNDSGIWRSIDAIGETGAVCDATDSTHFQNLNGGLGSLAEVVSAAQSSANPFANLTGLGVNGTAGVKSAVVVTDWPEILGGEGGPVAVDYSNNSIWYANNEAGVSIHVCSQAAACTPAAFGVNPVINDADVSNDGLTMTTPAPFLVDRLDHTQLLIATCRVWRGPANGTGWSASNAISPILDGDTSNSSCSGDPLIRTMAAASTTGGGETIYVGMYGSLDGGATLAGHVFGAKFTSGSATNPVWQDLTLNPVTNDSEPMNYYGLDISSIFIDPHDPTGNTVYVTVEGFYNSLDDVQVLYQSTDGGAHWAALASNLLAVPVSSVVVDPQDANTVYIGTDVGVFSTRAVAGCSTAGVDCWTAFGTGLPEAPVTQLLAAPATASSHVLTAATYGRGVWQNPLWTASAQLTMATVKPTSLAFGKQQYETTSSAQTVTLTNTGTVALTAAIGMSGDFSETDDCQTSTIAGGASCTIQVKFTPTQTGARTGQMTISANVTGGQLTVALSGTGTASGSLTLIPPAVKFGQVTVGTRSSPLAVSANNTGQSTVAITSVNITGPFEIFSNTCGSAIAADSECQLEIEFSPTKSGSATGTLTMIDGAGTQSVLLSGSGAALPTDTLSTTSLTLPATVIGEKSAPMNVVMTNSGDLPLTSIGDSIGGNFQVTQDCGTLLAGHASCAFSVVFAPKQLGVQTGTLTISDELRIQKVKLSGIGVQPPKFSISPSKLSFAPETVGATSAAMKLTVSNKGGAPMANVSFQTAGPSAAGFVVSSTTCGKALKNGSRCTAQVKFKPAATGANTATLIISSSTIDVVAAMVPLSGTGLAPPEALLDPPVVQFNTVIVGASSAAQAVTITNVGGAAYKDMHLAIVGDYKFVPGTCTAVLAVGAKCTARITFAPTATGSREGVFTISSVSHQAIPATATLEGTGIGPATIQTSSSALDLGSVQQGQTSSAQTLTVFDVGTESLKGLSLTVTGAFQLQQNHCHSSLSANVNCSTQVVFAPVVAGAQTGTLTVASTTQWTSPVVVALTGTGVGEPILQVSPQQLTFGSVQMGNTSTGLEVSVSNPGGASIDGLSLKVAGDFALSNNTCGTTLFAGNNCATLVVFSPTASGTRTGALTISGASPGLKPVSVQLSGMGESPGSLTVLPSNLLFGNITEGQVSPPQTATIGNTSQSGASGLQFKVSSGYRVLGSTCGSTLAAGGTCTLQLEFAPKGLGNLSGTLTASSTSAGVGSAEIVLSGAGVPPAYLVVSPTQVTFPGTAVGLSSSPMTVTLIDPGIAAAGGIQAQTTGDFSASVCASSLPAGGSCKMKVIFNPTGQGIRAGQLTVTTTAPGAAPAVVSLLGTGTAPPAFSLNPTTLNFPGTAFGQTSAPETIAISNSGSIPLNAPSLKITGDFHVTSNTCIGSLAVGGSCNVQIDFAPIATGGRAGTLTVSSTTKGVQPATANLTGIGLTTAAISVAPLELTFPVTLAGRSSAPQTVKITNAGGSSIASLALDVSPQFAITANKCKGPLAPDASCTAGVVFEPLAEGAITGGLTITSPSVPLPANVALSGTGGAPPAIVITPAVVNFPTTGVGHPSSSITVTISNPGTVTAVTGLTLKIGAEFRLVDNNCKSVLGAKSSCTTGIEFVPSKAGTQQSALAVSSTSVKGGSVTLMGTGFDFTIALKGTQSQSVASGQTASYTLSIATLGGSEGVFTFQCGSLPQNALCIFNPTTETVTADATGFVTAEIATGHVSTTGYLQTPDGWRIVSVALGLVLLPLAWRKRRRSLLLVALLALTIGGVTSCLGAGGGGPTNPQNNNPGATPAGTYSVPITAISNGVQHSVKVSLTVD
ncbi:MAG: choice-of-anchor D domain-containing protein [Terracidiphilus sp.]